MCCREASLRCVPRNLFFFSAYHIFCCVPMPFGGIQSDGWALTGRLLRVHALLAGPHTEPQIEFDSSHPPWRLKMLCPVATIIFSIEMTAATRLIESCSASLSLECVNGPARAMERVRLAAILPLSLPTINVESPSINL